ncbi:MAG: tryptophan--tRNA ligase [Candidatus Omnitrophica bacterium]|nr:tryptophan--tRNA ligase [Candidatus Omnitrophota bacterium]
MTNKRVLSGIQPTGGIHLGNYLGAVQNWVRSQDEYDNIFCIVDLHAITVYQDPKILRKNIRELAGILFACGLDPQKCSLFVQSDVTEHTELTWILNCTTPIGWMKRMTQFKDKSDKQKEKSTMGLFDYPVLMAADILLYETDLVPVGEDQKQHVELTRDIAEKFNGTYGPTFKIPEPVIPKVGARVMGLDDPAKKMSKSEEKQGHAIFLLDEPDVIRKKIMRATTDSLTTIQFDESRAGIYNLLCIYQVLTGEGRDAIEKHFEGKGYGDFKKALAEVVIESLRPLQEKYQQIIADPHYVESLLKQGASKIRPIARRVVDAAKDRIGLGL